jgi:hypothetical protein
VLDIDETALDGILDEIGVVVGSHHELLDRLAAAGEA